MEDTKMSKTKILEFEREPYLVHALEKTRKSLDNTHKDASILHAVDQIAREAGAFRALSLTE